MRLLAKSRANAVPSRPETLEGHLEMTANAARILLRERGEASLRSAGLPLSLYPKLSRLVLGAASIHDLAKAEVHSQKALLTNAKSPPVIRHEALLVLMVQHESSLRDWLRSMFESNELEQVLLIAAAHHRKFPGRSMQGIFAPVHIPIDHPDFARCMSVVRHQLEGPPAPQFDVPLIFTAKRSEFIDFEVQCEGMSPQDHKLIALARTLMIEADVAASALPGVGEDESWLLDALRIGRPVEQYESILKDCLGSSSPYAFQEEAGRTEAPVVLILAGCGAGKTVAAYLRSQRQYPHLKMIQTLPTTGTATQTYVDYVGDRPQGYLTHSRRRADLDLLSTPDHDGTLDRLASIRAWEKTVITCTADAVLGLMEWARRPTYDWVNICQAHIVFDEIHEYDSRLFQYLLDFLRTFPGIPITLMTATLPETRLQALQNVILSTHGHPLVVIHGPEDREQTPRYQRITDDPWEYAMRHYRDGGKVLWVSNTVDRCIQTTREADRRGVNALTYHARFRYMDRCERHAELVERFRGDAGVFAITTQVAQISLDISSTLLVTDIADVGSLIQRLGRLGRYAHGEVFPFLLLPVLNPLPYSAKQVAEGLLWAQSLGTRPLSQRDLAQAWVDHGEVLAPHADPGWLNVWETRPRPIREEGVTAPYMMESDHLHVLRTKEPRDKYLIPMLVREGLPGMSRHRYHFVVPDHFVDYDPRIGAQWRPQT